MNDTREQVYVDRRPNPAKDNSPRLALLAGATVLAVGAMSLMFWLMASGAPPATEEPVDAAPPAAASNAPTPTPTPEPTSTIPAAPPANELVSNEWLLSPYAVQQDNGNLVVTGTLQNLSDTSRSATVTVYVYVSNQMIAAATGQVADVAAGESVEVSFPSGMAWQPGSKVLLVVAQDPAVP